MVIISMKKTLDEVAEVTKLAGFEFTKYMEYIDDGEIIAIRALNLKNGRLVLDDVKRISKNVSEELPRSQLHKYDIVLSYTGTIGESAQIMDEGKYHLAPNVAKIVPKTNVIDPKYLFYYIRGTEFKRQMINYAHGSTQPTIPMATIRELTIPVFGIETERKIANILNAIDDRIENNIEINKNLAAQIETLLLSFLDSEDATLVKLGDYLYIKGRIGWKGLKKSEYLPQSEYRIINGETLTQSGIDWNKAGYISEERYIESPEIMLKVGDILLSKDGTIGKIGYVDSLEFPTSVASGIFVIRNIKPDIISTTFIYYLLKSQLFSSFIVARTEGSVIPHLYQKDFMEFEFPLPTPEKMAKFEENAEPMFSQIVNNLNENKKLTLLRDSLLPKLMSGKIDVSSIEI